MDYDALETEIVARLNAYFASTQLNSSENLDAVFTARTMPEDDSDFTEDKGKAIVNVHYADSGYSAPKHTGSISQTETIVIALYIQARKLRGDRGAHNLLKHVKTCMVGFRPTNAINGMYISTNGKWTFEGAGLQPFLEMSFDTFSNAVVIPETAIGGTVNGTPNNKSITITT